MESASHHQPIATSPIAAPLAIGGLFITSALLAIRRLLGAFESALPVPALVATATFIVIAVWFVRIVWPRISPMSGFASSTAFETQFVNWAPVVTVLLAMIALSWPMARVIDWLVWLPILAGEAIFLRRYRPGKQFNLHLGSSRRVDSKDPSEEPADAILQQLTRIRDKTTGEEALYGTLCAEFAVGERVAVLHVAFCPPLDRTPEVHAEQADGPQAAVRVTQVLAQGTRLEVRLARESAEPSAVTVDFAVH